MPTLPRTGPIILAAALTLALLASAASAQTSTAGARSSPAPARAAAPPTIARPTTPSAPVTTTPGGLSGGSSRTRTPVTGVTPSTGASSLLPPTQQVPQVAPPSQQLPTQFSTGGTTQSNLALSPGASGTSSSAAPSAPGGGGKTLRDCMGFWEAATHMSKSEWKAACLRTMDRIANP